MQGFNFGLGRKSVADSVDDRRSRYAASSVYSGVVDDTQAPSTPAVFSPVPLQGPFEEDETEHTLTNGTHLNGGHLNGKQPQFSSPLSNIDDPVAMHLLTETAINDSSDFQVLSFDEVEQLKKERALLRHRVEATRRKLALETKMRDAAQSLAQLFSSAHSSAGHGDAEKPAADDEYSASGRKVQELSQELLPLERRLAACDRRILEHTAAILQMSQQELQKNARRGSLPHSPESMSSRAQSASRIDGFDDFDDRSLYQLSDSIIEAEHHSKKNSQALGEISQNLDALAQRLHAIVVQSAPDDDFDLPPQHKDGSDRVASEPEALVKAQMAYIDHGLDAIDGAQARAMVDSQRKLFDSEDRIHQVNTRLNQLLARTNSASQSPDAEQGDEAQGKDLPSQLSFATAVLERLERRVETLAEQKDILTRQIQQQRELNSKSDAQRDARIFELTEQLERTSQLHEASIQESQHTADQVNILIEQLDQARQHAATWEQKHATVQQELEQQRGLHTDALEAQEGVHGQTVEQLRLAHQDELEAQKELHSQTVEQLHVAHQDELESQRSQHGQTVEQLRIAHSDELDTQKTVHQQELDKIRAEAEHLQSEVLRFQTELTVAKAELDGAYGSRAQRAAEMSTGLSKKNEELEERVNTLQTELQETIEDYELMTRQSIDFEKERDRLEQKVDQLERRCENLESQLHEEKVKGLGSAAAQTASNGTPTTSTAILRDEFKKMMRDARAEHMKSFKAEQDERRRLEGIIRGMRKDLGQTVALKKPQPGIPANSANLAP